VTFDATSSARWPGIGDDIESARLIADRIGVSQMQVSRILRRAITRLGELAADGADSS